MASGLCLLLQAAQGALRGGDRALAGRRVKVLGHPWNFAPDDVPERNGTQRALFQALWQIWGQRGLCSSHCTPDLPGSLTSLRVSPDPLPLACVWGRTSEGKVAEAVAGTEEGDWGLGPESCPEPLSGDSPLISRKSSAMTTGPLSMGLPEPLKTRPGGGEGCWGMLRASPGSPSLLLTLHTVTASHRPLVSLSHQPSVTHRELATPSSPGNLYR